MHATAHRGCTDTAREPALKVQLWNKTCISLFHNGFSVWHSTNWAILAPRATGAVNTPGFAWTILCALCKFSFIHSRQFMSGPGSGTSLPSSPCPEKRSPCKDSMRLPVSRRHLRLPSLVCRESRTRRRLWERSRWVIWLSHCRCCTPSSWLWDRFTCSARHRICCVGAQTTVSTFLDFLSPFLFFTALLSLHREIRLLKNISQPLSTRICCRCTSYS